MEPASTSYGYFDPNLRPPGDTLSNWGYAKNVFQELMADTKDVLLLDEPTSNLDEPSKLWFKNVLSNVRVGKLVIIASNEESDFMEGSVRLNIEDFR